MSRLLDGLLTLSRLSRTEIRRVDINVNQIAGQIQQELTLLNQDRHIEWNLQPGMMVWADESLFALLMQNLLANSWKFTSKKEWAKIEVGSYFRQDGRTVFYVKDNGAGFDMKYVNKLFGTFQRLHYEEEFEGTGIGLATARRIIHLHGGDIWAEGKENEGAVFYFYLPKKGEIS